MEFLKTIASRVIAGWVAGGLGYLGVKYGMQFDSTSQQQLVDGIVGVAIPAMTTVYAVAHKVLDKRLNPGDTASTHLAKDQAALHALLVAKDPAR